METLLRGALGFIPGVGPFLRLIPPGGLKVIALVLLIGAGVLYIDRHATHRERDKCKAAALQAKLDAAHTDLVAANQAAADRDRLLAESDAARTEDQKRIADYEQRLKANPACVLTDDDWRAVDGVRGPARRRPR